MRLRLVFCVLVWLYLALALLYALNTPPWQVPDEPAHYNYIRTIAEQGMLPILQFGDYDQRFLDEIKSRNFPANMSIDTIRYESHQPPLYYLIAAPFYKLGEAETLYARMLSLRLVSVLLGVPLLAVTYRIVRSIFAGEPLLALFATAVVAFVPQHLAIVGGVENDALAEVVLAATALLCIRILAGSASPARDRNWFVLGLLIGAGFLTKTTTFVSVGLLGVTAVLLWRAGNSAISLARHVGIASISALCIGGAWFVRDAAVYGPTDWLGLGRHNAVVVGQPRTLDLFPTYLAAAGDFFPTLFRSFWGQFGWMGVLLDMRIYGALLAFSVLALVGIVPYLALHCLTRRQISQLLLLAAWFAFVLGSTIAYSFDFYQAQGRYLFPALSAIALAMAMGMRGWLSLAESFVARAGTLRRVLPAAALLCFVFVSVSLDLVCLYRFVVPELSVR